MLAVLSGSGFGDIAVVVTRYFGGTKLGTGGLVRAYSDAVRQVLADLPRAEKVPTHTILVAAPYAWYDRLQMLIRNHSGKVLEQELAADVTFTAQIPVENFTGFQSDFNRRLARKYSSSHYQHGRNYSSGRSELRRNSDEEFKQSPLGISVNRPHQPPSDTRHPRLAAGRAGSSSQPFLTEGGELCRKLEYPAGIWQLPGDAGLGQIDIAYVSLPNHLHAEWSIRALQAGVHVLCEKPFAITLEKVDQMIETSRQTGKFLAEGFMYRHHPQTKLVGEWVRAGRLGEISQVTGVFNFKLKDRKDVRLVPEYGGGCLWDVGVYPLSFAQYVFGEPPEAVFGMQWTGDTGVDETFAGQMQYPGDRFAQIACSFRTDFHTQMEITGTEGRLILNRPFSMMDEGRHLMFYPNQGEAEEIRVPKADLYSGEVEDMHSAILDNKPNTLTLQETRNHIRTVLALYESARTGKPVSL